MAEGAKRPNAFVGRIAGSADWSETIPLYYHRVMGISTNKASDMVSDQAVTAASSPHEGQCQLTLSLSIVGLTRNMVSDHIQPYTDIYPYTAIHHIYHIYHIYSHVPPYIAVLSIVDIYKKLESVFSRGLTQFLLGLSPRRR
jgi:hypothetical protein